MSKLVHLYSENHMHETACLKPLEGRGRVRNITGVERDGTCQACLDARRTQREREQAFLAARRAEAEESPLLCATCSPGHALGALRKPCRDHACECWCNRSSVAPRVDNESGQPRRTRRRRP